MSYNIEDLEKAFGVHQDSESLQDQQIVGGEGKVMDKDYISKVHDSFEKEYRRVSAELMDLEAKTNQKRLEFTKLQGAYELLVGFKRDLT